MKHRDGMTRLDDFGVVDDARERFKQYVAASVKLSPKDRAAWWREVFEKDPESLRFFRGDELR